MTSEENSIDLGEKSFSIGDESFIFDILRSKMYSNPILSVCREITCNARDAMREAGKDNIPIKISLPTQIEPFYKVKDFGVGISPERIEDVFIKYGTSTKRENEEQTGAYGLGSKSPFSITDSFNVITNYNGVKYSYLCYIDETKVGKLALLSQESTEEENGTEIQIPVDQKDFHLFSNYTKEACDYWDLKPIINGFHLNWSYRKVLLEGTNWKVVAPADQYSQIKKLKIIIDGIKYDINYNIISSYTEHNITTIFKGDVELYFKNKELSLSATREQLFFDAKTKAAISERIRDLAIETKQILKEKISTCSNFYEANFVYNKIIDEVIRANTLGDFDWKNNELFVHGVYISCPLFYFTRNNDYSGKSKKAYHRIYRLEFRTNTKIYVDDNNYVIEDNDKITYKNIKKAFEEDLTLNEIFIVCPNEKQTLENLNKSIHFDLMNPIPLSSIWSGKASKNIRGISRLTLMKFEHNYFSQSSLKELDTDTNEKVLCVLSQNKCPIINGKYIDIFILNSIKKNKNISFYGVKESIPTEKMKKEFAEFKTLEKVFEEEFFNNYDFVRAKFANSVIEPKSYGLVKNENKIQEQLNNKEGIYSKYIDCHKKILELRKLPEIRYLNTYEQIKGVIEEEKVQEFIKNNPELDLVSYMHLCDKKYPMLKYMNQYALEEDDINKVVEYINLIDKEDNGI